LPSQLLLHDDLLLLARLQGLLGFHLS
jgi:hypothetical protein